MKRLPFILFILVAAQAIADPVFSGMDKVAGGFRLSWTGGEAPFEVVRHDAPGTHAVGVVLATVTNRSLVVSADDAGGVFEVRGQPSSQTARYRLTFTASWSAQTHPQEFPPGPHFSALIGVVHHPVYAPWFPGFPSSTGIKNLAELGDNTILRAELASAAAQGLTGRILESVVIGSPGSLTFDFDASQVLSQVSFATMIAPSPDWFTGVHNLNLFVNGDWVEDLSVDLFPWDAGTDSGTTHTAANQPNPPVAIEAITGFPFLNGGQLTKLGTFRFVRRD